MVMYRTRADKFFDTVNSGLMGLLLFMVLYPLWFVVISSLSDPDAVNGGRVVFWIVSFTLEGYQRIFGDPTIWTGYYNSLLYALGGMAAVLFLVLPFAYAISVKSFVLRGALTTMMLITWYFHGGLIPTYLVVKGLGLIDTRWAVILVGAFGVWNVVIARTFFANTIPKDLWEASVLDGSDHFTYFFRVVLPLSKAIIAVIALFALVSYWNDFFKSLVYINDASKFSLQLILRAILIQAQSIDMNQQDVRTIIEQERTAGLIKYGVIIVASLPMLIAYPFIQKYFVTGVMVGSVKG